MQPLERAVAIFCIACICAELTTQLAGSTWARRCIKAVAGLYILVVFARTVPQAQRQIVKDFFIKFTNKLHFAESRCEAVA